MAYVAYVVGESMAEDKRCKKTKKAIKNAFIAKLAEKSYDSITVSEIAELADINRKTFYTHYEGVFDVLEEIEDDVVTRATEIFKDINVKELIDNPYPLFERLTNALSEEGAFFDNLILAGSMNDLERKIKERVIDNLAETFPKEHFNPTKVRDVLEFIAGGMLAAYMRWLGDKQSETLEELCITIGKLVIYGAKELV